MPRKFRCPDCDREILTYLRTGEAARCPACGAETPIPEAAEECPGAPERAIRLDPPPLRPPPPHSAASTGSRAIGRREKALIGLGVLLLVAFLLPVAVVERHDRTGKEVVSHDPCYLNIETLDIEGVPHVLKVFLLFPGLAGIALVIIAVTATPLVRSISVTCIGGLGYLLLHLSLDWRGFHYGREAIEASEVWAFARGLGDPSTWVYPICLAATACLLAGSRARWYCPWSRGAAVTGAVGGGLFLLYLLLPSVRMEGELKLPVVRPFLLLEDPDLNILGATYALAGLLGFSAAVICLSNWGKSRRGRASAADAAYWLYLAGIVVIPVGFLIFGLDHLEGKGELATPLVTAAAKGALLSVSIGLVLPLGLSDLMITTSRRPDPDHGQPDPGGPTPPPATAP